jgi:uncharacterized protein
MTETPNPDPTVPGSEGSLGNVGNEGPAYAPAYQQAPQYAQPDAPQSAPYGYSEQPSQTDVNWAGAAHWGSLVAAWFAMGFLAPLLVMLTVGNQSAFVRRHAVESLNFQISLLIYSAVAVVFSLVTFGLGLILVIPLALVAFVIVIVFVVQASIKAVNGQEYRYPLTLRLVR